MRTSEGPTYGQPNIRMAVEQNAYRTFFTEVTGPADAMHTGEVVVAYADGSDHLVLLGDVTSNGDQAVCNDYAALRCQKHVGNSLRVVDEDTRRFQGLHIECDRCETLIPYRAGMTLDAMGAVT